MEPGQQFCLRWNNYQSTLQHVFHKLWISGTFVDVSLVVEGHRLDCHKVVLSACSSYFENILRDHSSHPHPLILLHDLPYSAVEALVTFMYRGEVNVSQEQLAALLRVAETLKVKGLADSAAISSFTKRQLLERCIPLLEHAPPAGPLSSVSHASSPGTVTMPTPGVIHHRASRSSVNGAKTSSTKAMMTTTTTSTSIKRPERQSTSPGPQRKRPRSEDQNSLPPTPPASQNDTSPNETSQPSPASVATPEVRSFSSFIFFSLHNRIQFSIVKLLYSIMDGMHSIIELTLHRVSEVIYDLIIVEILRYRLYNDDMSATGLQTGSS